MRKVKTRIAATVCLATFLLAALPLSTQAIQPDAPFVTAQMKHAAKWAKEDKTINAKLATLEKKFGKRPKRGCASEVCGRGPKRNFTEGGKQ